MQKPSWRDRLGILVPKSRTLWSRGFVGLGALMLLAGAMFASTDKARADATVSIFPQPDSLTCGSASNIQVQVRDFYGFLAPNGTAVSMRTTLGSITNVTTNGGFAYASLVIPTRTSGTAVVTASALGVSAQKSINVTCASGSSAGPVPGPFGGPFGGPPSGVGQPGQPVQPTSLSVRMANFNYTPSSLTVRAGTPVSVNLTNAGPAAHTFTIAGITDSGSVAPGASRTLQFTAPQAGNYTFYCTIHGQNVMSGTLSVAQGAPGLPSAVGAPQSPSLVAPLPPRVAGLPGQLPPGLSGVRPPNTGDAGLIGLIAE